MHLPLHIPRSFLSTVNSELFRHSMDNTVMDTPCSVSGSRCATEALERWVHLSNDGTQPGDNIPKSTSAMPELELQLLYSAVHQAECMSEAFPEISWSQQSIRKDDTLKVGSCNEDPTRNPNLVYPPNLLQRTNRAWQIIPSHFDQRYHDSHPTFLRRSCAIQGYLSEMAGRATTT